MPARIHTLLSADPLAVTAAHSFAADPAAGAVVVFTGNVRNDSDGRAVSGLTYEAYPERVEAQMRQLAMEVGRRWPDATAVWLEHRTGELAVGEVSVVVAVSCPHRAEAFDAAHWAIDELKATAAIWKQEHWAEGGAHWVGSDG